MTALAEPGGGARCWTLEELDRLPNDGYRYELLDGRLLVSPLPVVKHQLALVELLMVLRSAGPPELMVLCAPVDWRPGGQISLQPDLLIVDKHRWSKTKNVTEELFLIVEVLSPATRQVDLVDKRATYESAGVPSYWVVDVDEPSVVAWELVDGRYQLAGKAQGSEKLHLERPFPVTVIPAALVPL